MKNKFIKYLPIVLLTSFLLGCDDTDENTGDSSLEVNKPTVTINYPYATNLDIIESDTTYPFTISISQAVSWDVALKISVKSGTATNGTDYSAPEYINIPAGSTTGTANIKIFGDDIFEETESFTLIIGDPVINATASPIEVTFNIANLADDALAMHLSWAMSETTTDNSGEAIDPTDFADLIFSLSSTPDNAGDIDVADGGSFEDLLMESSLPDGTYYLSASFYSANEDIVRDLNLMLDFSQPGVAESSLTFPAALSSGNSCSSVYYLMAMVIKNGGSYTITGIGENSPVLAASFIGTSSVVIDDWADYHAGDSVEIEAGTSPNEFWIRNYTNPAIANAATAYLIVTIDPLTSTVTAISNEDYQYGCSKGVVTGTGVVNACSGTIDIVLDFDLGNCGVYPDQELVLQL